MGSIFKLTALAGVAAGAYAAVKKFAPNILPDKNEAEDMAKTQLTASSSLSRPMKNIQTARL